MTANYIILISKPCWLIKCFFGHVQNKSPYIYVLCRHLNNLLVIILTHDEQIRRSIYVQPCICLTNKIRHPSYNIYNFIFVRVNCRDPPHFELSVDPWIKLNMFGNDLPRCNELGMQDLIFLLIRHGWYFVSITVMINVYPCLGHATVTSQCHADDWWEQISDTWGIIEWAAV